MCCRQQVACSEQEDDARIHEPVTAGHHGRAPPERGDLGRRDEGGAPGGPEGRLLLQGVIQQPGMVAASVAGAYTALEGNGSTTTHLSPATRYCVTSTTYT